MTKTENRAAAKAHYQEQEQKRREFARAEVVKADLAELERLRQYLMFGKKPGEPAHELIDAIDDYVAKLTGEDDAPHAQSPLRMSWCRVFDDTILLPGRKALRTLLKAGEYSSSLPKKEHAAWMASRYGSADPGAEGGGPTMFARIDVMRELNRHHVPALNPKGREPHCGRGKLNRDQ